LAEQLAQMLHSLSRHSASGTAHRGTAHRGTAHLAQPIAAQRIAAQRIAAQPIVAQPISSRDKCHVLHRQRPHKQTNKQAMEEENTTRKITLREFKPESYKTWEISTKATLKYNKLFNIVDCSDADPTPRDDDGTILRPIPAVTRDQIAKWKHDHERAREAIIRCLPESELLMLYNVQFDVTAMCKRLHDEYSCPSNLEYVRASNDLANLKKDEKTTINDHINKFEQLVHDVNYNKPSNTGNMEESVVNLKFLNTLMVDQASSDK
jgi:hypothetical protein